MSDASNSDKLSEFIPVTNVKEAVLLLKDGAGTASLTLWTKNQDFLLETRLTTVKDDIIYTWFSSPDTIQQLEKSIAKVGSPECFFNMQLKRASVFFKTIYAGSDHESLKFLFPQKIYKVQRRKDFRMPIRPGHVLYVDFDDPLAPGSRLKYKLIDLSAGGISFGVPPQEEALFEVGGKLRNLDITIKGVPVSVDGIIRHKKAIQSLFEKELFKIGVQFSRVSPRDEDRIAAYVLEEGRKYFMSIE